MRVPRSTPSPRLEVCREQEEAMTADILIIDDSLTVRKIAERQLVAAGYSVSTAETGSAGLDFLRDTHPRAVLLDYMLPDMKGTDVCHQLTQTPDRDDVPIIVLSGSDGVRLRKDFSDVAAVKGFIEKPFVGSELIDKIRSVVDGESLDTADGPPRNETSPPAPSPQDAPLASRPEGRPRVEPGARTETDRVGKIVEEILKTFEKPADTRRLLLRLIVRKHLR